MRPAFLAATVLALSALAMACGDTVHRPIPPGARQPGLSRPPALTPVPPARSVRPLLELEAEGRSPVELSASAVEGFPPLPTYRAVVKNLSDRPVRRVVATVVYRDANGRAMAGENQDVAFGSPLKPIEPGGTLESSFLSRVDRAPSVRLVARTVTLLEPASGGEPVPREWSNPRYAEEVAKAAATP